MDCPHGGRGARAGRAGKDRGRPWRGWVRMKPRRMLDVRLCDLSILLAKYTTDFLYRRRGWIGL